MSQHVKPGYPWLLFDQPTGPLHSHLYSRHWPMQYWFYILLCFVIYGDIHAKEKGTESKSSGQATLASSSPGSLCFDWCPAIEDLQELAITPFQRPQVLESNSTRGVQLYNEGIVTCKRPQGSTVEMWTLQEIGEGQGRVLPDMPIPLERSPRCELCPQLGFLTTDPLETAVPHFQISENTSKFTRKSTCVGVECRPVAGSSKTSSGTGTKRKRQRQRTVMAIASLASVCCWFDQFGILGFDYYNGIATVEGPIGSTQKGSGEALTRSPQHDSTGPSPRLQEHHTATTCGSFPAWTGSQISPGVGESQNLHVSILGHIPRRLCGTLDSLCRGLQDQRCRIEQTDRRSQKSSPQRARKTSLLRRKPVEPHQPKLKSSRTTRTSPLPQMVRPATWTP